MNQTTGVAAPVTDQLCMDNGYTHYDPATTADAFDNVTTDTSICCATACAVDSAVDFCDNAGASWAWPRAALCLGTGDDNGAACALNGPEDGCEVDSGDCTYFPITAAACMSPTTQAACAAADADCVCYPSRLFGGGDSDPCDDAYTTGSGEASCIGDGTAGCAYDQVTDDCHTGGMGGNSGTGGDNGTGGDMGNYTDTGNQTGGGGGYEQGNQTGGGGGYGQGNQTGGGDGYALATVSSSLTFATADLANLAPGSTERATFEADFKSAMAYELAGVDEADITVDEIVAGSVVVRFSITVDPAAASAISDDLTNNMPATLAVGSYDADTSTMETPAITGNTGCSQHSDCAFGEHCDQGTCVTSTAPECASDGDCRTDEHCDQGTCATNTATGGTPPACTFLEAMEAIDDAAMVTACATQMDGATIDVKSTCDGAEVCAFSALIGCLVPLIDCVDSATSDCSGSHCTADADACHIVANAMRAMNCGDDVIPYDCDSPPVQCTTLTIDT